jgi:(4S)-4-hydroxy-5-phosphonooxypentane-2,3-dione isomerase
MHTVFVHVNVNPEEVEAFTRATIDNATNSRLEAGVLRFDIFQEIDEPTYFIIVEVYKHKNDAGKHKETAHYKTWRSIVEDMMAEPRKGIKYQMINPD